jgi:hypothetical protein
MEERERERKRKKEIEQEKGIEREWKKDRESGLGATEWQQVSKSSVSSRNWFPPNLSQKLKFKIKKKWISKHSIFLIKYLRRIWCNTKSRHDTLPNDTQHNGWIATPQKNV